MDRMTIAIEWKAADDDAGTLEGYASTFGNVDLGDDVVEPGAFTKTLRNIRANGIPLLADHVAMTSSVLGTIYDGKQDGHGLRIKARFSKADSVQDVRTKLLEGHLNKLSIGYEALKFAYEDREGKMVRLLQEVKLWEASVVVIPMNPEAVVSRVKSLSADERKVLADALAASIEDDEVPPSGDEVDPEDDSGAAPDEGDRQDTEPDDDSGTASDEDDRSGWDHWTSEAVLRGADPTETAKPAQRAGLNTTSELLTEWLSRQTQEEQS